MKTKIQINKKTGNMTIKTKQTRTPYTSDERTRFFNERAGDSHRVIRNKKTYTRKQKHKKY